MPPPSIFQQSVASRRDMFPGSSISATQSFNLTGIPGLGDEEAGMVAMFAEPVLQGMLGPGYLPAQFKQTHNLYDQYRKKATFQAMQGATAFGAEMDQGQYVQMLKGLATTAGIQWDPEKQRAAQKIAQDMGVISPMLAQVMPDTFDALHGRRGSAAVMGSNIFAGARYMADPITGRLGMSSDSVNQVNRGIYEQLYGPGANLDEMAGLGAGRAGQMYDELSRRGLMGRSMSRSEQLEGIARQDLKGKGLDTAGIEKGLGGALEGLTNLASPQLEMKIRQFEAARVGDRIKSMAGAVSAMKDVFGEMGRPDAPMSELIEGLQVITQGGLATMAPGRVESLVRDTANMARRSGMGMDNMTVLMADAGRRAQAMNLDSSFGVMSSLQSAAFGSAYGTTTGGSPAWGRADKERMMAIDSQLRLNAADSTVGNQLAATRRLGRELGFKEGSEANAAFQAIEKGQKTYTFNGETKSVYTAPGNWRQMMEGSGVDVSVASAYRSQTANNKRFIDDGLLDLTRSLQAEVDFAPRFTRAYEKAGRTAGLGNDQAAAIGKIASEALISGELSPEDRQDTNKVALFLAKKMGVDPADRVKFDQIKQAASLGWGNLEQLVRVNPRVRGYKSADALVSAASSKTGEMAAALGENVRQEGRLQKAFAGVGGEDARARFVDAIIDAKPDTGWKDIAQKTIGWIPEGEVGDRVKTLIGEMKTEIGDIEKRSPGAKISVEARKDMIEKAKKVFGEQVSDKVARADDLAARKKEIEKNNREIMGLQKEVDVPDRGEWDEEGGDWDDKPAKADLARARIKALQDRNKALGAVEAPDGPWAANDKAWTTVLDSDANRKAGKEPMVAEKAALGAGRGIVKDELKKDPKEAAVAAEAADKDKKPGATEKLELSGKLFVEGVGEMRIHGEGRK